MRRPVPRAQVTDRPRMWRAAALVLATAAAITTLEATARPDDRLSVLLSGLFPAIGAPVAWYLGPRLSARASYNLGRLFLVLGAGSAAISIHQWRGTPIAGAMAFHMVLVVVFAAVFFDRRDVVQLVLVESVLSLAALVADGFSVEDVLVWIMMLLAVVGTGFVLSLSVQASDLLSYGDPLTGAANRRAWDIVVAEAAERHRRHRSALSVALIDIDRFKSINDEHGHERGDEVLRDGVAGWRRVVRATDTVARLGGDEFGVLLPGVDHAMAMEIAGRLLDELDRATGATCSIGVATRPPGVPADDLVAEADRRLYQAKASGRARVVGSVTEPAEPPERDPAQDPAQDPERNHRRRSDGTIRHVQVADHRTGRSQPEGGVQSAQDRSHQGPSDARRPTRSAP